MKSVVEIRKDFLTEEEINLLIDELPQFFQDPVDTNNSNLKHTQSALGLKTSGPDFNLKETDTLLKLTGNKKTDEALKLFTKVLFRMKKEMEKFFGIEFVFIQCNLNRILPGGHNWPPHIDDELGNHKGMEYAALLYLGDYGKDFTGGEIIFSLEDLIIQPQKGLFVFFKADSKAPHGVKEVLSGHRDGIIVFLGDAKQIKEKSNEQN